MRPGGKPSWQQVLTSRGVPRAISAARTSTPQAHEVSSIAPCGSQEAADSGIICGDPVPQLGAGEPVGQRRRPSPSGKAQHPVSDLRVTTGSHRASSQKRRRYRTRWAHALCGPPPSALRRGAIRARPGARGRISSAGLPVVKPC